MNAIITGCVYVTSRCIYLNLFFSPPAVVDRHILINDYPLFDRKMLAVISKINNHYIPSIHSKAVQRMPTGEGKVMVTKETLMSFSMLKSLLTQIFTKWH